MTDGMLATDNLLLLGQDDASYSDEDDDSSVCDCISDEDEEQEPNEVEINEPSADISSATAGRFAPNSLMSFMAEHVDNASERAVAYNRTVALRLRQPDVCAICPISLDTISSSEVCGFEGFILDETRPTFTEAVLACGHSFSTCYLVVSWLTSPMRCPLCRAGIDQALEIDSIPCKWKQSAEAHVARFRQDEENQRMIELEGMQSEEVVNAIFALHIHMCVYITLPDATVQAMVVDFVNVNPITAENLDGIIQLHVPRAQIRAMSRLVVRNNAVSMNLVVFARHIGRSSSIQFGEITQSGPLHVPVSQTVRGSELTPSEFYAQTAVPVRDVVVVQRSDIHITGIDGVSTESTTLHHATFSMNWQVYPSRLLNTLLDISFCVKLRDLALFLGGLISEN
jgi:hypothetical protein